MHARLGELLEVEVLDDRDPRPYQQEHVTGKRHAELGVGRPDDVPGNVVGADRLDAAVDQPPRATRAHAGRVKVLRRIGPERAVPGAHQHDVTHSYLHSFEARGLLQLLACDGVVGRQKLAASHVQQNASAHQRRQGVDAMNPEADRGLHPGVDVHATVKDHVLSLVCQGVDVRAGVLGHHDEAGRARSRLGRAARMVAMEKVIETRRVGRVRGRAGEARLLEIEDPGSAQKVD